HDTGWHHHRRAQLIYASQGVMRVRTRQGLWVVPPQRAVWMPPLTAHQVQVASRRTAMRHLYIEPDAAAHLPDGCCVVRVSPLLRELILRAAALPPLYDPDGPDGRLVAVILDQIEGLPVAPLHLPDVADFRLRPIADALAADPADPRTLADFAIGCGASARTLARLFRRDTGLTFGQWRQQARLLAALTLLAEGRPVTTVALDLGYDSQSAFIAMFRRAFGVTPGRYFAQGEDQVAG
ncbi:MAG: helix-turn-helix transcriptional regulator, partial [Rhodobacterales bacterium]|nr:helix-turn-helix transcriptional regulator [Rhodobacterales bacterium]